MGYTTELDKSWASNKKAAEEAKNYVEAIKMQDEVVKEAAISQLAEIDYTKKLADELMDLVYANGKVKAGYEARVSYILNELNKAYGTQYELIDGEIKGYKDLQDNIYKTISAKRAETLLSANEAIYSEALKRDTELYLKKSEAIEKNQEAVKQLSDELNEYNRINRTNISLEKLLTSEVDRANMKINARGDFYIGNIKKAIENYEYTMQAEKDYVAEYERNNEKIIAYENGKTAIIKGDEQEIAEAMQALSASYSEETNNQTLSLEQQLQKAKEIKDQTLAYYKKNNLEITDDLRQSLDNNIKTIEQKLEQAKPGVSRKVDEIANIIKDLGPDFKLMPKIDINPNVALKVSELKRKLQGLADSLSGLTNKGLLGTTITSTINAAINRLNALGYAGGGFPEMGQLFMAREAGPELVGSIGNRNAVVNNQQIVEAVSTGVANAVASVLGNGGSNYQLIIDGEQITDVVQRRLARRANITGMAMGV